MPTLTPGQLLLAKPVFLDTETTGLAGFDEVIEVSVVDIQGATLVNTLVKPACRIHPGAFAVHGISHRELVGAPCFDVVWRQSLLPALRGRPVLIYNAGFDVRMISQSLARFGLTPDGMGPATCLMQLFARWRGERASRRGGRCSLEKAILHCGLALPETRHRSLADALLARTLFLHMAGEKG